MSKRKPPKKDIRVTDAERKETNHMDVFRRLANIKNMHGSPGDRKPKK